MVYFYRLSLAKSDG